MGVHEANYAEPSRITLSFGSSSFKRNYMELSMSVEALLKLRDDIGAMLSEKGQELKLQLQRLEGGVFSSRGRGGARAHPPRPGLAEWDIHKPTDGCYLRTK